MSINAFTPLGNTIALNLTNAALNPGVQAPGGAANVQATAYRFKNSGAQDATIGYGKDSATAIANAVIPTGTGGNATQSLVIGAGVTEVFTLPPNVFFSGIVAAGTATVYVTPGDGV